MKQRRYERFVIWGKRDSTQVRFGRWSEGFGYPVTCYAKSANAAFQQLSSNPSWDAMPVNVVSFTKKILAAKLPKLNVSIFVCRDDIDPNDL